MSIREFGSIREFARVERRLDLFRGCLADCPTFIRFAGSQDQGGRRPFTKPQTRTFPYANQIRSIVCFFEVFTKGLRPLDPTGNVLANMDLGGRTVFHRKHVEKSCDAISLGGRHRQAFADIIECSRRDPAKSFLYRMEGGQKLVTLGAGAIAPQKGNSPFSLQIAPAPGPGRFRRTKDTIHNLAFQFGGFGPGNLDIHQFPSLSTRMAHALNSAVPAFGSVSSIVRMLVLTLSWK